MSTSKIGFVGLGRMGSNMARRLHEKGHSLTVVYDLDASLTASLAAEIGATPATSLAEVTALAEIIFTVVTNDQAMESIFFGHPNLLTAASGRVFINCATLTPAMHRRVESASEQVGARCLEACMASSIPQARKGELFLMVGGQPEVFEEMRPLLEDLAQALHYLGPVGKASEVKALVNMVMNIHTAALAEGLALGEALGLDLPVLCEIFSQTGANSRVLETDAADMIQRDHACFFSAEHAAKDSGIALSLAADAGVPTPVAEATYRQFQRLVEIGQGHLDKSGIAELTFKGRQGK